MKKVLMALVLVIALAAACCLTACDWSGNRQSGNGGKFGELNTTEEIYGFSAASAGMLISSMNDGSAAQLARAKGYSLPLTSGEGEEQIPETGNGDGQMETPDVPAEPGQPVNPEEPEIPAEPEVPAEPETQTEPEQPAELEQPGGIGQDGVISELDEYMALVDSLLSDGVFRTVTQTSDRPEYTEKMVVSYKDISGNTLSYVMYYNQIPVNDRWDDDRYDRDDRRDRRDRDGEREEEYYIEGIMIIDGAEYEIRGEKETETEKDEFESEVKFRVTLSDTSYMLVEQKYEEENEWDESGVEQEYTYSVYEGRRLVERSAIEYEQENEDGEDELEIKLTSYKDGKSTVFYFERETIRGEEVIRIRVGDRHNSERYIVRIADDGNGGVKYVYDKAGR